MVIAGFTRPELSARVSLSSDLEEEEEVSDEARDRWWGRKCRWPSDSFIFRGPTASEPWHSPSWTGGTEPK